MQFTTKVAKVTIASDVLHWGGNFAENGLFIVLEVTGSEQQPAPKQGKEILDLLLTRITNYKERNLTTLKELTSWAKEIGAVKTLTLGFLHDELLYLANIGSGEVILQREGKVGKILASGEISSGRLVLGDRLLFTSKTFNNCIDREKKEAIFKAENITNTSEEFYTALLDNPNSKGATALLVELESQSILGQVEQFKQQVPEENYKKIISQKWHGITSFIKEKQTQLWKEDEESKSKKTLLTIAIILIFLLVASIFLNVSHSQNTTREQKLKQTLDLVTHQYDEAVSLIDLNPVRARLLLSDSKLSLSQILPQFPKDSKEYKEVNEWLGKIAEKEVAAYKIFKFTQVPIFFDINLIKNGGIGSKMALHQKTAVILDSKNKVVYSLSLDTKKAGIIAGSEILKDTQTVAVHGQSVYVLTSEGIVKIDIPTKGAQTVVKTDQNWGEIGELVAFAGNLYLLDRKNNAIWKYIAQESGFSGRASYLNSDVRVNLSSARKMVIDGSVWVLTDSGILKFTSGRGDNFAFKGLADSISAVSIFTSDTDKNLYVLDKQTPRILVFDKDGNYQSQYQWDELKNADDILVSEEEEKIFVLSKDKIYSIDLQ